MSPLDQEQISVLEKQCDYVPLLMNQSRAVRGYIKGLILKVLIFIFICVLVKIYEKVVPLLIIYSVYFVLDTYFRAIGCMRKHMINNLGKAVIIGRGVVTNKSHRYPEGIIGYLARHSKDDGEVYQRRYFSTIEILIDNERKVYNCTNATFGQAAAGDQALIVEFPEEYEVGKYCCFLEKLI